MPLTAALTADLPLSATCSTPDRAADALPDTALLLAACAAVGSLYGTVRKQAGVGAFIEECSKDLVLAELF